MRLIHVLVLLVAATIKASPLSQTPSFLTAASIQHLSPATSICPDPSMAPECRTASQALPHLLISFTNFDIPTFGAQAALLALILYESAAFRYSTNQVPGVPGQGTRNMQSPAYNLAYARWLSDECADCRISAQVIAEAQQEGPVAVLALVNTDQWGFGSAAWFLRTQCDAGVVEGLAGLTIDAWRAYLACVGAGDDEARNVLWNAAVAMGGWR